MLAADKQQKWIEVCDGAMSWCTSQLLKELQEGEKHVQRDKNGNANNVFYAILAHPSHMQFLLKSQNTNVTNTQLKISYSKHTVTYRSPIKGFRLNKM